MQNAKDYYRNNKDQATITYAWFSARVKKLYQDQTVPSKHLHKSGTYYLLNYKYKPFKALLKRL